MALTKRRAARIGFMLGLVVILAGIAAIYKLGGQTDEQPGGALHTIASFTLKGCGSCNDALDSLESIKSEYPDYDYASYDILENTDLVEKYAVEKHPTVLFLNEEGEELGRVEQNYAVQDYQDKIEELRTKEVEPVVAYEAKADPGSTNTSLFYPDRESAEYVEITQFIRSESQVKFPKIAAMHRLLELRDELPGSLENPFPEGVRFVNIDGADGVTIVTLSEEFDAIAETEQGRKAVDMIVLTLGAFKDVSSVQVMTESFQSDVLAKEGLSGLLSDDDTYVYRQADDWTPVVGTRQYNVNLLHRRDIEQLPCFCGCESIGHESNHNCYFGYRDGERILDPHAENCQICLDITDAYVELKGKGMSIDEIEREIRARYES